MLSFVKALAYVMCHPFDIFYLTVVRRYVDAQGHFIGELYEGTGREAHMIGASCDNWPLDADTSPLPGFPSVCWRKSFLDALPKNTLRVGSFEPESNARVQAYVAMRRWLPLRVTVHNRFVEYILEQKKAA